ncbi:MAG: metallopeptidase TldD-related protein, partial [Patescibacteria group bacterium]
LPAPNTSGPIPLHLAIAPGTTSKPNMVKKIKKGLLITRLWYIRVLNPRSLSLTGMTRDGLFSIEDGEITGGVKNMRFNQSIPEMLNNIVTIENKLTPLSSFESEIGINRMPSLHVKDWTFSSGTLF